jgi:hypothetical protein
LPFIFDATIEIDDRARFPVSALHCYID